MKREFLMLSKEHKMDKHGPCYGWKVSEKLDGMRAFWDGGISRGIPASEVPFANTRKHARYTEAPISTGLWSRYGQPIQAPNWWLDKLPPIPLDGELWAGRGKYQTVTSVCRRLRASSEWESIWYMAFDSPPLQVVLGGGAINNKFIKMDFGTEALLWASLRLSKLKGNMLPDTPFYRSSHFLSQFESNAVFQVHQQLEVPNGRLQAEKFLSDLLTKIESLNGEGLMLRNPCSFWKPERTDDLLKLKRIQDMEGTVLGYKWGKPTDLDGSITGRATNKLVGLMGCVILKLDSGVIFDLGVGFTEDERVMTSVDGKDSDDYIRAIGKAHVGEPIDANITNPNFPRLSRITFAYRELTNDNCPKEARYKRLREEE